MCVGAGGRLEDPVTVAASRIDFVPPAETNEAPAGNVFEIVEVDGEEEESEDEDEDAARQEKSC